MQIYSKLRLAMYHKYHHFLGFHRHYIQFNMEWRSDILIQTYNKSATVIVRYIFFIIFPNPFESKVSSIDFSVYTEAVSYPNKRRLLLIKKKLQ